MMLLEKNAATLISMLETVNALGAVVEQAGNLIADALLGGDKLLACGNGGSAADAAHITTEFVCRFEKTRPGYPAICLNTHGGDLTAISNDFCYEDAFARQVNAFGKAGDVLIAISTSGSSENVRRALAAASAGGLTSIALLGRDGGACKGLGEMDIIVPGDNTARIQEVHALILHTMTQIADDRLAAR